MNILFLTLAYPSTEDTRGIYVDLMKELKNRGNNIYVAAPIERKHGENTKLTNIDGISLLQIKTGNIQKVNIIEKGVSTLLIEHQFKAAIKKYFNSIKFDLIIYSTPPITFAGVIKYVKQRDNSKSYLLLKDIFPQNAVDMGMIKNNSILHKYFLSKEKGLYLISDVIGCMSPRNKEFLIRHNPYLKKDKIEICPNSIKPLDEYELSVSERELIRQKYNIPKEKKVLLYGGNLGKPQGIDYLIQVLKKSNYREDIFILIVGNGTEYSKLEKSINENKYNNVKLLSALEKSDYDKLLLACDIGLILLDHKFIIPNFPSRLLSYMEAGMPILAATDKNTDIGQIIEKGNFGLWNESIDVDSFWKNIDFLLSDESRFNEMRKNSRKFLIENYTVKNGADIILKNFI